MRVLLKALAFLSQADTIPGITSFPELVAALDSLDDHLAFRTFLVGHEMTVADWGMWGALKCNVAHDTHTALVHSLVHHSINKGSRSLQKQPAPPSLAVVHPSREL